MSETNEFHLEEAAKLKPTGQVLADSDALAFIYIVEENDEYSYLTFDAELWPALLTYVVEERNPIVQVGNEKIQLEGFYEEMAFLLPNIAGNSNYGESFVERVESVFAPAIDESL